MRISLFLGGGADSLDQLVQQTVDAERDGFDAAWFGQIFANDALTVIALAGQRTSRIELGTSVVPTYPRHPFVMAQQALTVNVATGGRLALGLGVSHGLVVENMWGMSYDKPARHMREYLTVLRALVQDGRVAFQGQDFRVNANLQTPGATPFPILIAALAPAMLRIAGELADGTITWMTGVKAVETHVATRINEAAKAAGRPAPRICVGLPVAVTDDEAGARERAGRAFTMYGQLPNYRRILDVEGAGAGPADVAIVGDEASVERQVRALASAGATELLAAAFPAEDDAQRSVARTREVLKGLIGNV